MIIQTVRCIPEFVLALSLTLLPSIAQSQPAESIIIAGSIERKRVTVTRADLDKLPKHTTNIQSDGTKASPHNKIYFVLAIVYH
jgi:DNA polymerase/3'-5' exonuclease PolX